MFFSVIIPCYNSEEYIEECINSIYENVSDEFSFEVIIINDGSKDKTLEILNTISYKFKNLLVVNNKNFGPSFSRNIGIKMAKGEYLLFLDSDDSYLKGTLIGLYKYILNYQKPDVVEFNFSFIRKSIFKGKIKKINFTKAVTHALEGYNINSVSNKSYNRNFINENSIFFNENLRLAEDLEFNTSVFLQANNVLAIPNYFLKVNNLNFNSVTRINSLKNKYKIINQLKDVFNLILIKLNTVTDPKHKQYLRLKLTTIFYSIAFNFFLLTKSRSKTLNEINSLEKFDFNIKGFKNIFYSIIFKVLFSGK